MFTYCNCKWVHIQIMRLSTKYAQIWGTVKIMPCYIYSSTENEARAVWINDAPQTKIR